MSHFTFSPTDLDRALLNMPISDATQAIELAACEPEPEPELTWGSGQLVSGEDTLLAENLSTRRARGFAEITSRAVLRLPLGLLGTLALWFWQSMTEI